MHRLSTDPSERALQELLHRHRADERADYDVAANHAPMVLIALHRMGAGPQRMHQYYAGIEAGRPDPGADEQPRLRIDPDDWTADLGSFEAWSAYRRFFQAEIDTHGAAEVLGTYVSPLMHGVAGHAFHPLLRLGYAIDLGDDDEIASGLGYWAAAYIPAPEVSGSGDPVAPARLLEFLESSKPLRALKPDRENIDGRIGQFFAHEPFQRLLRPLKLDPERPLEAIAQILAQTFARHHHFTMLHAVTSCQAMRLVLPFCADPHAALSAYWSAISAAYLSVLNVFDGPKRPLPEHDAPWSDIQRDAIATGNEHTIKLAYTCQKEWEVYGDATYRGLALRELEEPAPFV